ncbi:NAD(P)-binding domain-containing protein [Streptococcus didelphis]|uniref:NAD(P)-binding domain-containing protein n=1 Tax=Streptococcus didelphis TaxID=102886 RepID=A0ABY9LHY7_9STRE|nr:NAD(P)-dependent oxidoreductase [Streptococcus didelphis]WMB27731.1 NAD(P)-binding domain-containing protein [Streptococcus didelphis]WMB29808.1 NAD(P)-binding domain-containing protein [Streptococcus didelphis]
MKIICYGVRDNEIPYFNDLNTYNYDLTLCSENLSHDNVETAKGHDAVLLRANNVADKKNLDILNSYGIKYVFTRTVGYSHIDLDAAKANNQVVAYVPTYSPYAVAELAFALALQLHRNLITAMDNSQKGDFKVYPSMFAPQLSNLTVGIIGTGRIGLAEAKLWKATGAKVIGFDIYENEAAKEFLDYRTQEELLAESDIVSLHVPHIIGVNDKSFNSNCLSQMKDGAILVNTARAEITDEEAILKAIESGKLRGFATDVISREKEFFNRDFDGKTGDELVDKMQALYPRVIITPHIGSYTADALTDMISISFNNFNDILTKGESPNRLA